MKRTRLCRRAPLRAKKPLQKIDAAVTPRRAGPVPVRIYPAVWQQESAIGDQGTRSVYE